MANTFIDLNDTPSDYSGHGSKFVRVNADANALVFGRAELNDLDDVQTNLAYVPSAGQALIYSAAAGKWRPGSIDVYSSGNGLSKSALTLNVVAGNGGGLTSNTNGVFITDISNVSGTWGNTSYIPVITVNSKGQITSVTPTLLTATQATTITSSFVGNVNGTSGQISVLGGKGNNSNATLNLVATGVTAGTYGSATHTPRITVDTYGRIQQVDTVEISGTGGGNNSASLGFSVINVAGQTQVAAEVAEDTLTLVAGSGISITTNANADSVTFATNVSFLAASVAANIDVADLRDVDASGITNGQVLIWNSSTSKFEAGNMSGGGGSNVDLTDFSITTASPSGNGSLTYNNAGVFTFTPAAVSSVTQSLSWNASTYNLSISGGNTVDLSVLKDNTDAQTLSLSGNTITISGSNSSVNLTSILSNVSGGGAQTLSLSGNTITISGSNSSVNLTSALGNVAGNYGNSNVVTLLGNVSANIVPSSNNTYSLGSSSNRWKELHLSGNTIYIAGQTVSGDSKLKYNGSNIATESYVTSAVSSATGNYGNSNVALYLSDNSYATQTYVTTQINTLTAGAPAALNTLAEIANALNNSNSTLATVAFTGNHSSLSNRPTMSLASNTYLLYDGSNVNLSSVIGQQGIQGVGIIGTSLGDNGNLFVFTNNDNFNSNVDYITTTPATLALDANSVYYANVVFDSTENDYLDTTINNINFTVPSSLDGTTVNILVLSNVSIQGNLNVTSGYFDGPAPNRSNVIVNSTVELVDSSNSIVATSSNTWTYSTSSIANQYIKRLGKTSNISFSFSNVSLNSAENYRLRLNVQEPEINLWFDYDPEGIDSYSLTAAANAGIILNSATSTINYDYQTLDLGNVVGHDGVSVSSGSINGSGNLILTLSDSSIVDVGNVHGNDGVSVSSATVTGANLIITLSNSTTIDAGNVRGPQGIQGLPGDGNAGIANATVAGNNDLIIGLVNGTYVNAGNVRGPIGPQGNAGANGTNGVGITSVSLVSSNLVLNYSNTSSQDVGNIRGPQGNAGTNGVNVSSATVNVGGNLILTLSNAATIDAGNVRGTNGTNGANGILLSNLSVTTAAASGNGSLSYSNVTGVFTFTPPDLSTTGDITGVTAGTGLSGGGASGTVTLSLGTSGVTAGTYGNATTMPQLLLTHMVESQA